MDRKIIVALLAVVGIASGGVLAIEYFNNSSNGAATLVVIPVTEQDVSEQATVVAFTDDRIDDLESLKETVPRAAEQNNRTSMSITQSEREDYIKFNNGIDNLDAGCYVRYEGELFRFDVKVLT